MLIAHLLLMKWLNAALMCGSGQTPLQETILICREIESLKERYETKLAVEKKLAVTLKGENGLMRKRFSGLEKAIDEQKAEIRRLHEAQDTLYTTIAAHEKDMQAFKEARRLHASHCACCWSKR